MLLQDDVANFLEKGLNQSEVARCVKVVRQTVARWGSRYRQEGAESLKRAGRAGRKPLLSETDRKRLERCCSRDRKRSVMRRLCGLAPAWRI